MAASHSLIAGLVGMLSIALAEAQTVSVEQARKETCIDKLELLSSSDGINYGYVPAHTTLGKYYCGAMAASAAHRARDAAALALRAIPGRQSGQSLPRYLIRCSDVTASGQAIGGVPLPPVNLLMIEAEAPSAQLQHLVLHELYHLMEYRTNSFNDGEWLQRFGSGYKNSYRGLLSNSPLGSGEAGFASAYGQPYPMKTVPNYLPSWCCRHRP